MLLFRTTTKYLRCLPFQISYRYMSSGYEAHFEALHSKPDNPLETPPTFESIGLRGSVVKAAQTAFPNLLYPTETQCRLIPAILENKDVILADETGSGKSLGIVLALLNKPRLRYKDPDTALPRDKLSVTSLLLVPHRDLANQLYTWIHNMASVESSKAARMSSIAQVLVRDGAKHTTTGLELLKEDPPHILIATPQAIADIIAKDPDALKFSELSTVALDEIDYLVETVPRNVNPRKNKLQLKRAHKKLEKHPGATTELLSIIYEGRIRLRDGESEGIIKEAVHSPQLIASSATLRRTLHAHLFQESGWMDRANTLFVRGVDYSNNAASSRGLGGGKIQHSVVVVKDGRVKNMRASGPGEVVDAAGIQDNDGEAPVEIDASEEDKQKYRDTSSPFDQEVFEAVSAAFALDVPSVALLVLKADAPVHRAVYDLRTLGVNAMALNIAEKDGGGAHLLNVPDASKFKANPVLLVCTRATFRGIDFPELSHVFVVDFFESRMKSQFVDEYLQIAGRVGRFGRGGKVVSFINDNREGEHGKPPSDSQVPRFLHTFDHIGVKPVRFEHFE